MPVDNYINEIFSKSMVSLLILIAVVSSVNAAVITVCPEGCHNTSIQSAIDMAADGDIIEVGNGTYYEHISINKRVSIVGGAEGSPVVDADGYGSAITVYADGATLKGLTVRNSGGCGCGNAGIKLLGNNNTVTGNNITDNKYGIYAGNGTKGNIIYNNNLYENDISAYDDGKNQWYGTPDGVLSAMKTLLGMGKKGNRYSDYDTPEEGCTGSAGVCERQYNISGGSAFDQYPLVSWP